MKKYLARLYNKSVSIKRAVRRLVKEKLNDIVIRKYYNLLANTKFEQKQKFNSLKARFLEQYQEVLRYDEEDFVSPAWQNWNKKIEREFTPHPPFNFLRIKTIRSTMFVAHDKWFEEEMNFLKNKYDDSELNILLREDYVGKPVLAKSRYLTSYSTIHHLYGLARYVDQTKMNLSRFNTIVEWGGGYGDLAKIARRHGTPKQTYIIIDTALFTCLQWLYLSTIFGEDKTNLIKDPGDEIKPGLINILPIALLKNRHIKADLFISTWALSESSENAQSFVINNNFFDTKHFLVAYDEAARQFPSVLHLEKKLLEKGCKVGNIKFLPSSRLMLS